MLWVQLPQLSNGGISPFVQDLQPSVQSSEFSISGRVIELDYSLIGHGTHARIDGQLLHVIVEQLDLRNDVVAHLFAS